MLPLQWAQIWSLVGELRPPMLQSMSPKKKKYVPSMPTLLRVFIINGCWILSNAFSASIEMIIWFLSLILLMWSNHIDWFADIDPSSQPRINLGFPGDSDYKKKICPQCGRPRFNSWVGEIPWRREQLPTPVFLPGEFYGQKTVAG